MPLTLSDFLFFPFNDGRGIRRNQIDWAGNEPPRTYILDALPSDVSSYADEAILFVQRGVDEGVYIIEEAPAENAYTGVTVVDHFAADTVHFDLSTNPSNSISLIQFQQARRLLYVTVPKSVIATQHDTIWVQIKSVGGTALSDADSAASAVGLNRSASFSTGTDWAFGPESMSDAQLTQWNKTRASGTALEFLVLTENPATETNPDNLVSVLAKSALALTDDPDVLAALRGRLAELEMRIDSEGITVLDAIPADLSTYSDDDLFVIDHGVDEGVYVVKDAPGTNAFAGTSRNRDASASDTRGVKILDMQDNPNNAVEYMTIDIENARFSVFTRLTKSVFATPPDTLYIQLLSAGGTALSSQEQTNSRVSINRSANYDTEEAWAYLGGASATAARLSQWEKIGAPGTAFIVGIYTNSGYSTNLVASSQKTAFRVAGNDLDTDIPTDIAKALQRASKALIESSYFENLLENLEDQASTTATWAQFTDLDEDAEVAWTYNPNNSGIKDADFQIDDLVGYDVANLIHLWLRVPAGLDPNIYRIAKFRTSDNRFEGSSPAGEEYWELVTDIVGARPGFDYYALWTSLGRDTLGINSTETLQLQRSTRTFDLDFATKTRLQGQLIRFNADRTAELPAAFGDIFHFFGNTARTLRLPDIDRDNWLGHRIFVNNVAGDNLTITKHSSDRINAVNDVVTLAPDEFAILYVESVAATSNWSFRILARDEITGAEIVTLLEALTGNARLQYSAIRNTPTIPTSFPTLQVSAWPITTGQIITITEAENTARIAANTATIAGKLYVVT